MTVMAMEVVGAEKHPNADALRLYKMKAADKEANGRVAGVPPVERPVQEVEIIANLDRIYELGDVVAIALPGSILKDGTKIKPTKLRGIYSYGMALDKVEAEVGKDLSELYCQPEAPTKVKQLLFIKWTSIELLHNVKRELDARNQAFQLTYRAKVKLHGTNAGVQITPSGEIAAQKRTGVLRVFDPLNDPFKKRTQVITSEADNAGFAAWVEKNGSYFSQLKGNSHLTIFGEWCGSGIQKGVAIS